MSEKNHYQDLHIRRLHHSYLLQSIQQVYVLLLNFCYFLVFLNSFHNLELHILYGILRRHWEDD